MMTALPMTRRACLAAVVGDLAVEPADVGPVPLHAVPLRCGTQGSKPTTLRIASKAGAVLTRRLLTKESTTWQRPIDACVTP